MLWCAAESVAKVVQILLQCKKFFSPPFLSPRLSFSRAAAKGGESPTDRGRNVPCSYVVEHKAHFFSCLVKKSGVFVCYFLSRIIIFVTEKRVNSFIMHRSTDALHYLQII